ncbi:hypothetical protein [Solilutibacter tolerans]|uniref:hypothetical protein n=1 Tax=Solilutibacter tolerans TaxID=1604334 RepID=UPI00101AE944|nr:hypothetical protein [Lysobacter tolerans]
MTANQRKNLAVAGLALIALAAITAISLNPDSYYFRNPEDREHWHHPTGSFLVFCGFIVGEAVLLAWAMRLEPQRRIWKRSIMAAALLAPWAMLTSVFVVHAPGYMHFHIIWVWAVLAALVLASAISVIAHLVTRGRSAA